MVESLRRIERAVLCGQIIGLVNLHNDVLPWPERWLYCGVQSPPAYGWLDLNSDIGSMQLTYEEKLRMFVTKIQLLQKAGRYNGQFGWTTSYGPQRRTFYRDWDATCRRIGEQDGKHPWNVQVAGEWWSQHGEFPTQMLWTLTLELPQIRYHFETDDHSWKTATYREVNRTFAVGDFILENEPQIWGVEMMCALHYFLEGYESRCPMW
jgi:hypothetical protein